MSAKELEFDWREYDCNVKIDHVLTFEGKRHDTIRFIIEQHDNLSAFELDRSQAHLLMLYLQEHLK